MQGRREKLPKYKVDRSWALFYLKSYESLKEMIDSICGNFMTKSLQSRY